MTTRKQHESMDKLDKCYKLVQQSSAKGGMQATEIAEKMGIHRTTVYNYLNSLQLMGKVVSDQGFWKATKGEQTIKPLEKEIVIELPIPDDKWQYLVDLELIVDRCKELGYQKIAKTYGTILEKFNETRTIKIKGKNVDDLNLEKIANLIKQATEDSSKINLKRLIKRFKP